MFDCMNFSKHCIKREGQVSWVQEGGRGRWVGYKREEQVGGVQEGGPGGWGTRGRARWVKYEMEE